MIFTSFFLYTERGKMGGLQEKFVNVFDFFLIVV